MSLNFLEMVSIAAMLAVFLAPEQKHRRLILFSSVMNICVYSEEKVTSELHTFTAAHFQMNSCFLGWVYGTLCESGGEYLWFWGE